MIHSSSTPQKRASLAFSDSPRGYSVLHTRISGWIPWLKSCLTLCCAGLVFNSLLIARYTISATWMKSTFSLPLSLPTWRIASINGSLSISPTVPPISVITKSASVALPAAYTLSIIAFVMWGIVCTVPPRYSPLRSLFNTDQ